MDLKNEIMNTIFSLYVLTSLMPLQEKISCLTDIQTAPHFIQDWLRPLDPSKTSKCAQFINALIDAAKVDESILNHKYLIASQNLRKIQNLNACRRNYLDTERNTFFDIDKFMSIVFPNRKLSLPQEADPRVAEDLSKDFLDFCKNIDKYNRSK